MTPLFAELRQVCVVAEDSASVVRAFVDDLGIGPFRCWRFAPPRVFATTFRGKPERSVMDLAVAWVDDVQIEVIAPLEGRTLYREYLESHGRGVQHVLVGTGRVPFSAAARRLGPVAQSGKLNTALTLGPLALPALPRAIAGILCLEFAYFEGEFRTAIELHRYPPGFSPRFTLRVAKPDFTVPDVPYFERPLPSRRVGKLRRITIATRDLDATMRAWSDLGGLTWRGTRSRIGAVELVLVSGEREGVESIGFLPGSGGFDATVRHCLRHGYTSPDGSRFAGRARLGTDFEILSER